MSKLGVDGKTNRGFSVVMFQDASGLECSLQQSSAIEDNDAALDNPGSSLIWLGVDDCKPQIMKSQAKALGVELPSGDLTGWMSYPIPDEVLITTRMHLSREQAKGLIARLQSWLETGTFERDDE